MRDHDFDPWFNILLWVTGTKEDKPILRILLKRIKHMYTSQGRRRNLKQVYLYLKECYTIVVSVKVGSRYDPKMGVAVGKVSGLPLIIPGRLRQRMLGRKSADRKLYIVILTMLGIHRIIPWWPAMDLGTVTERFNGLYTTLHVETLIESKRKLCELAGVKDCFWSKLQAVVLLPESAGPNAVIAWKGVLEDLIAILRNPRYWWSLWLWYWHTRSYVILLSFSGCSLLMGLNITFEFLLRNFWFINHYLSRFYEYRDVPKFFENKGLSRILYILFDFDWDDILNRWWQWAITDWDEFYLNLHVGRLTAVYNTAGKARVIGITNYWTQVALYPLHREIFKFLEGLPTDGTYDQLKPVKSLVDDGSTYWSYDLTAATDRLPRQIQTDILKLFIGDTLANLWSHLVDMPFGLSKSSDGIVRYAVGQPMGAYSSWAMLALTHHMIVQTSGTEVVRKYAVLGDDVIVSTDAPRYLEIMSGFGVGISLAKSIISNEFVEFAKRVRTLKGEDYSIIGPGLIMSAVRNRYLSAVVLADALRKDLLRWTAAPKIFLEMPGKDVSKRRGKPRRNYYETTRSPLDFGSWVLFGPKGLISSNLSFALAKEGKVRVIDDLKHESMFFKVQIRDYLERETSRKWTQMKDTAMKVLNSLSYDLFVTTRVNCNHRWTLSIFYYLALWLSPPIYKIIDRYGEALESVNPWEEKQYHKMYIDEIILDALDGFPEMQISALEPLTRQEANNILRFYDGMLKFDPDAVILNQRRLAKIKWLKQVERDLRHRENLKHLASFQGIRTHGPAVPQDRPDNLKEGFKPFDINDI